jgi:hypothetical protein
MRETVIENIIEAIAEAEETDWERLDIYLHRYVSADSIRGLVTHESNPWRLQFETESHVVELAGNNTILVDGQRMGPVV